MSADSAILSSGHEVAAMWQSPQVQAARKRAAALWRVGYGDNVPREAEPAFEAAMDEYVTNYLLKGSACDTEYPRFVRNFQSPAELAGAGLPGARMGGDNPDNIYRLAAVAQGLAYLVKGRVIGRSAPDVSFSLMGNWGTSVGIATIGLHELDIDEHGRFALTIDDRSADGRCNHLTTSAHAKFLFVRDSLMDWGAETAVELSIQRLGTPSRAPLTIEEKAERACFRLIEEVPLYYWFTRLFSGRPANSLSTPEKVSSLGGLATQTSAMGRVSLAPDEVAIVRYDPAGARYASLVAYDWWFRSIDVDARQSSLTAAASEIGPDGWITCIVSPADPGVANWIDTNGLMEALLLVRWQGLPPDQLRDGPAAKIRVVKLSSVASELPGELVKIDRSARAESVARRRAGLLSRAPF